MKQKFSAEFTIILVVTVAVLAFITFGVIRQIFTNRSNDMKFVYNSVASEVPSEVNISDI
ncbi:MAG: hypothetical protein E7600_06650 [Ruminococcaceae bacterium]|nr:hypothetical protein [Oscillospiraceae bacterium]